MTSQPRDEWTYLRPEEFSDDDEVERIDAAFDRSAEEVAMHELDPDEGVAATVIDAGLTLERSSDDDEAPVQYFDDEEPVEDTTGESEVEPSVDQLLVSQHYTFDPEGQ